MWIVKRKKKRRKVNREGIGEGEKVVDKTWEEKKEKIRGKRIVE